MHIHTHIVCNAQDLNFKFKLKLGKVKLTQVLMPSSMLSRKKKLNSHVSLSLSLLQNF